MAWIKNWFSNMLPFDIPLVYDGITYLTVENFYQAMKVLDWNKRLLLANMNPYECKKAIRNKKLYTWRENWDANLSIRVMYYALKHKFSLGSSWATQLLATGNEEIVEWNNWNDLFWGKNVDTKLGENHLGKLLMQIRNELLHSH